MVRHLSWTVQEVLIKAIAQAILAYSMSVFKFPKELYSDSQAMLRRFWWVHSPYSRKLHLVNHNKLCESKLAGGMGFCDLESFNLVLLACQVWWLVQDGSSFVFRLLKARYFPDHGILDADLGYRPSFTWCSLWAARWVVIEGSRWRIGDGWALNIWEAKWIQQPTSFKVVTPYTPQFGLLHVSDFIDDVNGYVLEGRDDWSCFLTH